MPLEIHILDNMASASGVGRHSSTDLPSQEGGYITHREFFRNVFAADSQTYGYRLMQLELRDFYNILYSIISGCTLCSINLIGFPDGLFTVSMDLDFSTMDARRNVIAEYSVKGRGSAHEAICWGCGRGELMQVCHTKALHDAVDALKDQIATDSSRINEQLRENGPIHSKTPAAPTRK